jgi:uncharacterized membrane protein
MTAQPSRRYARLGRSVRALLLMIGFAPIWVPFAEPIPGLAEVARLYNAWFAFQCHREAARSLVLLGELLPVCTRCFGIYVGLGLGALVLRPRLSAVAARLWVGAAALLMALDVLTESLHMRPEWAPFRALSGVLLAYPVSVSIVWALRDLGGKARA